MGSVLDKNIVSVDIMSVLPSIAVTIKVVFIALALIGISNLAVAIFADVGVTLIVILFSLRLMR